MNARERIAAILAHEKPDRVGIFNTFWSETKTKWRRQIFPAGQQLDDALELDIEFFEPKKNKRSSGKDRDLFRVMPVIGPFEDLISVYGWERAMTRVAREPDGVMRELMVSAERTARRCQQAPGNDLSSDAVWVWDDIAYTREAYFSSGTYRKVIMPAHRELCAFFRAQGKKIFFHSDGNLTALMPFLAETGFDALHPVESRAGMKVDELKKKFPRMVFVGGISQDLLECFMYERKNAERTLREMIERYKEGGRYVFCFENPVPPHIDYAVYKDFTCKVKEYGGY